MTSEGTRVAVSQRGGVRQMTRHVHPDGTGGLAVPSAGGSGETP